MSMSDIGEHENEDGSRFEPHKSKLEQKVYFQPRSCAHIREDCSIRLRKMYLNEDRGSCEGVQVKL
jgi:hypothetical protein